MTLSGVVVFYKATDKVGGSLLEPNNTRITGVIGRQVDTIFRHHSFIVSKYHSHQ